MIITLSRDKRTPSKEKITYHAFPLDIKRQLQELKQSNNSTGLLAFLEDVVIISLAISIAEAYPNLLSYLIALVLIGSRMRALATILHESSHGTLAANRFLNDLLGYAAGFSILQIPETYKQSHLAHHRYLGDSQQDPDFKFHLEEGLYENMTPLIFFLKYIVGVVLLLRVPKTVIYLLRNRLFSLQLNNQEVLKDYSLFFLFWIVLVTIVTVINQWNSFFHFWVIPYLTTFQIVNWFCELGEHYPKPAKSTINLYMTHNRLGNLWESFLFGIHNEHLHLEHHLNPAIPFWLLTKSREIHLQDPMYEEIDRQTGGLFTRRGNATSAIEKMLNYHRK